MIQKEEKNGGEVTSVLSVRRSLGAAIGIVLLHRILMVVTENNPALKMGLNDFFNFALSFAAAVGMFHVAYRSRGVKHIQIAWTLLGASITLVMVGAVIFAILDTQGMGIFPSIADAFYLAFYPVFGAGLILMSWSSLSKTELVKTLIDIAIVMLAAFIVFWVALIAPTLVAEKNAAPLTVWVAIAFPICDWALIFAILRVLYSGPSYVHPASLLLLALAATVQVIVDGIYISESLAGTYVPGNWLDTLYIVNFSLLILVIAFQLSTRPTQLVGRTFINATNPQFKWVAYIPNLWAVVAYFLLVWAHDDALPISFEMLAWIVGGILGLVITRQIVATYENARLSRELQAELAERKSAEESVRKLNEELEKRILERTSALTREIAERKQAQAEREKLIVELGAKNKELERFTYTVSHDLKSPLVTIRGFLGLLEKDVLSANVERVRADMARIVEATDKMHRLLNELLELSRIGRMMNPPFDIPFNLIVQDAVELVHGRLAERGVTLTVAENMSVVRGDRMRLVQLMQNLIDNAVKFMGEQPKPLIEVGQRGDDSPIFFIRDNGMGIPSEYHDRIFGIFNKLDPDAEGTGIGLSLVKRIVEAHGGRIWVQSNPGEGTVFYFTLAGDGDH